MRTESIRRRQDPASRQNIVWCITHWRAYNRWLHDRPRQSRRVRDGRRRYVHRRDRRMRSGSDVVLCQTQR